MQGSLTPRRSRLDPRIVYRGAVASRWDNLTDAVFGIAITLLIFNMANPNSLGDVFLFTKTLPAFLMSIAFLLLIWQEHQQFSSIYTLEDDGLKVLNTLFIALVIFFVYPLRFLTLLLTRLFFGADIPISLKAHDAPLLMVYYGLAVFALYGILCLFYLRAFSLAEELELNPFERFHTRFQARRLTLMFLVPALSVLLTLSLRSHSPAWASLSGGLVYFLYFPINLWQYQRYKRLAGTLEKTDNNQREQVL